MFDRLLRLFRDSEPKGKTGKQTQREALLDLLVLTMFIDRHVASSESKLIRQEGKALSWEAPLPFEHFVDAAKQRARRVLDDVRATDSYLTDIARRLGSEEARSRAYHACVELVGIDGKQTEEELQLLERLRDKLEIAG